MTLGAFALAGCELLGGVAGFLAGAGLALAAGHWLMTRRSA